MPIYSFKCHRCKNVVRRICRTEEDIVKCSSCGREMDRIISSCPDVLVTEKRDSFKNKNVSKDIELVVQKRSKDYFVEHCVDEAIEKAASFVGEREAREMAKRFGWIDKSSGKKREKIDLK